MPPTLGNLGPEMPLTLHDVVGLHDSFICLIAVYLSVNESARFLEAIIIDSESVLSKDEVLSAVVDPVENFLRISCLQGHRRLLSWIFLNKDILVNEPFKTGKFCNSRNALQTSAHGGHEKLVEFILGRQGVEVDMLNDFGYVLRVLHAWDRHGYPLPLRG